jgi:sugar transferase (PEP-CTERM/EpsH1 system associated)
MERLLYIAHRLPYPPDKGERLRAFHQIRALAETCELTLASLVHDRSEAANVHPLEQICHQVVTAPAGGKAGLIRGGLGFLRGRSVTQGYFHSPRLLRHIRQLSADRPFDVGFGYCSSTLPYLDAVDARRRVLDLVDVDSLKWEAYARAARGPRRWLYAAEAQRVARLERQAVESCDAVLLVSQAEVDAFHATADNVHAVGNGVDTEYFQPAGDPVSPPRVVFTGTMSYAPNVEGVLWFVREVWPAVRQAVPAACFDIVGRDPSPEIRRLDGRDGIRVTGTVDDVRPYLSAATCAVCPLLTARGIQNKILEAMAMGRPVLATPAAAEGIDADADAEAGLLVHPDPADQARRLAELVTTPNNAARLGHAARLRILQEFAWATILAELSHICRKTSRFSRRSSLGHCPGLPDGPQKKQGCMASRPEQ